MAMTTYDTITRSDLAGFDKACIDLALEAQGLGWVGKMSSKGHLIMRAPDGETTMSISRRWTNGRSGPNMRATLDRWKRRTELDVEFKAFDQITEVLEREQFVTRLKAALTSLTGDVPSDVSEVMSAVYDVVLDREEVASFAFQCAKEQRISQFGWLAAYPDDPKALRVWNVNWAVFDRRDGRVVDMGGPRMTEQGNEWSREFVEVSVAERLAWERRQEEEPETEALVVEEERPYVCEVCGRTFKRPMNLGRHMSTIHKAEPLEFKGDPQEDGLDDLMVEPTSVQMDDHLTIVVDPREQPEVESNQIGPDGTEAREVANAMSLAIESLGLVAIRMSLLESERSEYMQRIENLRREYEDVVENLQRQVDDLTRERDNAVASVSALKSLVADL